MPSSHVNPTQVSETQPRSFPLQVTILRAHNLPRLKTFLGRKKRFYVTVTDGGRTRKTQSVRSIAQRVEWNKNIDFVIEPRSRITISLYVKMTMRDDILVGRQEIVYEPQHEKDIVFGGDDGNSTEATTLFLTIIESANRNPSLKAAVNTPSPTTADLDNPAAEGGATRLSVQSNSETMQTIAAATLPPLHPTVGHPSESDTPPVQPVVESGMGNREQNTSQSYRRRFVTIKFRPSGGGRDGITLTEAMNNVRLSRRYSYAIRNIVDIRGRLALKVRWTGYRSLDYEIPVSGNVDGTVNLQSLARRIARAIVHFMSKNAITLYWDHVVVHRLEEVQAGIWIPLISIL